LTTYPESSVEARRMVDFSVDCIPSHRFEGNKFEDKTKFRFFHCFDSRIFQVISKCASEKQIHSARRRIFRIGVNHIQKLWADRAMAVRSGLLPTR
jgi:hypothetical protein